MSRPRLVFFGTGPVSRATLDGLSGQLKFEAVITKPAAVSPTGRLHPSPVLEWAKSNGVEALTATTKTELAEIFRNQKFDSQLGLVVDYGIIIPPEVIAAFPLGIVNSHFSLLPQWRGADPISAALLSGQDKTGVSLMLVEARLDEGPLLAQTELQIGLTDTGPSLTKRLVELSNEMIIKILPDYLTGKIQPKAQDSKSPSSYAPKLNKSDGKIDWKLPAEQIERQIRTFIAWPGSQAQLAGKEVLVTAATVMAPGLIPAENCSQPGVAFKAPDGGLAVCCGHGALKVEKLKPAGKSEMTGQAFLAGHKLN